MIECGAARLSKQGIGLVHQGTQPRNRSLPTLSEVEQEHILKVLEATGGNRSQAARVLGISRQSLIERIKRIAAARGTLEVGR